MINKEIQQIALIHWLEVVSVWKSTTHMAIKGEFDQCLSLGWYIVIFHE